MEAGPTVVAVVVHRDRPEAAVAAVRRLRAGARPVAVVVVDNASTPPNRERLARLVLPEGVTILDSGRNAGFGPGANIGLRWWLSATTAPVGVVVPDDARFAADAVDRLVAHLDERADLGLVSADVGDAATPRVHPWLGAVSEPARLGTGAELADYPHGTLLALRRTCVARIGLFDERYFAYCEEADLGLRAAGAGWRSAIARDVTVANPGMGSPAALIDFLQLRNTCLLVRDHFGPFRLVFRLAVAVVELIVGVVRPGARTPFFCARARLAALGAVVAGAYGPPPTWLFGTRDLPVASGRRPPQGSSRPLSAAATAGRIRRR